MKLAGQAFDLFVLAVAVSALCAVVYLLGWSAMQWL
jgi:hypothetical protein